MNALRRSFPAKPVDGQLRLLNTIQMNKYGMTILVISLHRMMHHTFEIFDGEIFTAPQTKTLLQILFKMMRYS